MKSDAQLYMGLSLLLSQTYSVPIFWCLFDPSPLFSDAVEEVSI